jgi:hypothetical protein
MKVNCFRISEGPKLTPCDYSSLTEAINQEKARVWIDILDAEAGELEEKLDELRIRGDFRRYVPLFPQERMVQLDK